MTRHPSQHEQRIMANLIREMVARYSPRQVLLPYEPTGIPVTADEDAAARELEVRTVRREPSS